MTKVTLKGLSLHKTRAVLTTLAEVIGSGPYFAVGLDPVNGKNLTPFKLTQGRFATAPSEVVIDKGTADKEHFKLGDSLKVSAIGPQKTYKVVGITKWGNVDNFGTATAAIFTLPEAQQMFHKGNRFNSVLVGARSGVSQTQLQAQLKNQLGPGVTVQPA